MHLVEYCTEKYGIYIKQWNTSGWNVALTMDIYQGVKGWFESGGLKWENICVSTGDNTQTATAGEALTGLDISGDLAPYQRQYHGTLDQGRRASERVIAQTPYPGEPSGGLPHQGSQGGEFSSVLPCIRPTSYPTGVYLDVEMVQGHS